MNNYKYRSVRLDILAKDEDGCLLNIEVQNSNEGTSPERARYNASSIDVHLLPKGEDVTNLPTVYVILITRNDVLGKNKPLYTIERTIKEDNNSSLNNRQHIIYVNSKIQDETELGKLMHDFYCKDPAEMYNKEIADVAGYYKNKERGEFEMCAIMDELIEEETQKTIKTAKIQTTIETCQDLGATKVNTIIRIMKKLNLSEDDATAKVEEYWQ